MNFCYLSIARFDVFLKREDDLVIQLRVIVFKRPVGEIQIGLDERIPILQPVDSKGGGTVKMPLTAIEEHMVTRFESCAPNNHGVQCG